MADERRTVELTTAVQSGDVEAVRTLLEAGVNPSATAPDDTSLLEHAVWRGHEEITRLLVEVGAGFTHKSPRFDSPLTYAIGQQHLALVPVLLQRGHDYSPEEVNRAFFDAAHSGTPTELALLHMVGASVEGNPGWEQTPLLAALPRHDNVQWLLEHGANPNFVTRNGRKERPLHQAALRAYQQVRTVRLLLDAGAEPDPVDVYRHTPLIHAAHGHRHTPGGSLADRFAVGKILVEEGANVNAAAKDGLTPLLGAFKTGNEELAHYLLAHGASLPPETRFGLTPLIAAAMGGIISIAAQLLADGADINSRSSNGISPLLAATWAGNAPMVDFLLTRGADAALSDGKGATARNVARRKRRPDLIALLDSHTSGKLR